FYNFRILPFTEIMGSGLGLILGILYSWFQPEALGGKLTAPAALLALVSVPFIKPILAPIDLTRLQDRCDGEVCMQSTFSTCGPSSAATILKLFGQNASERQLAAESFTYRGGTEIWYLARVFRQRGLDTHVVQRSLDSTWLPSPAIAGVVLPGGAGHFIAVLRDTPDEMTIGDPLKGKVVIKKAELKNYYHFTGLFLLVNTTSHTR